MPARSDWKACLPPGLKARTSLPSKVDVAIKKIVVGAKAISWIAGGVAIRRWPKAASILTGIGVLYFLQLVDISPVTVLRKAAGVSWMVLADVFPMDNRWEIKETLTA